MQRDLYGLCKEWFEGDSIRENQTFRQFKYLPKLSNVGQPPWKNVKMKIQWDSLIVQKRDYNKRVNRIDWHGIKETVSIGIQSYLTGLLIGSILGGLWALT